MEKTMNKTGWLMEEFIAAGAHHFDENGKVDQRVHDTNDGHYTGYFWFEYDNGKCTKKYSEKTAPKWLLKLYEEVTAGRGVGSPIRGFTL